MNNYQIKEKMKLKNYLKDIPVCLVVLDNDL